MPGGHSSASRTIELDCVELGEVDKENTAFSHLIYGSKTLIKQLFDTKHSNGYLDLFQQLMSPFALGDITKLLWIQSSI